MLIVPHIERKSIPAEYPVWFPPAGKGDTQDRAGCRGYSVVPLLFFSQSTVFSKGVM